MSLHGLQTLSLGTANVDARLYSGHALLHVTRGAAEGNLAVTIQHSDDGAAFTDALTPPLTGNVAGADVRAEIDMDQFKRFIRLKAGAVGTAFVVGQLIRT